MIQDHELTQLSNVESGIISSLGFTGLGGVLGLAGPFLAAFDKVRDKTHPALSSPEIFYLVAFSGTIVLAVLCLAFAGLAAWRKKGLAQTIRERPKLGMNPAH